jgi:pimeloyl-ACP methyl ester carboxylesterase
VVDTLNEEQTTERPPSSAPAWWLQLMESRALFELGAIGAASPLLRMIGRGDNHPVLVLPGFTASDASTIPLRSILQAQGYWVHGWRLGRNLGPTRSVVNGIRERLDELHDRHDAKVSLIGWSLGGIYARQLALASPDKVRQVITLGSPFRINEGDRSAASELYDRLRHAHVQPGDALFAASRGVTLPVPSTAIYTKTDGVVRWWQCIESVGDRSENIEVRGSHSGLGNNPAVIYAIGDRLGRPIEHWKPFRAPPGWGWAYPEPADWRENGRDPH